MRFADLKLKHAWLLGVLLMAHLVVSSMPAYQHWRLPEVLQVAEQGMFKMYVGACMGYALFIGVHGIVPEGEQDEGYRRRRAGFVIAGFFALAIAP